MINGCKFVSTYKKSNASEIIEVGDIIMLDPASATVTRAVANDRKSLTTNSRLIIGVCIKSDNSSTIPAVVRGGNAKPISREFFDGGRSDTVETIILKNTGSAQNAREIIQVAYAGEYPVNICGYAQVGDKLCISQHAGKAKAMDYLVGNYYNTRSIGKVIKFLNETQVKVLLDIE